MSLQRQFYPRDPKVPPHFTGMGTLKAKLVKILPTKENLKKMKDPSSHTQCFLLMGGEGRGKSTMAEWIAERLGFKIIKVACDELYWFWQENLLSQMFELAKEADGCVILLDYFDKLLRVKGNEEFDEMIGKYSSRDHLSHQGRGYTQWPKSPHFGSYLCKPANICIFRQARKPYALI